ncbi:prenyltransferase/squalene oxidase repeat-containing protein [Lactonifactor longoviformis]|uniref:prenyltransferase/squalene oxidase repeat-containing protein n=1 Tax=Lactonifactor longoviformis TaxID=341220 RepID=UPI001D022456|nr:prenyltransferase/squalene oxidase repeat-containing protein [Lactonifactor longoviformis]MCB5713262.1 terpene cyclase/mutase family protein [Lactonifactor longoviformis]MCB5717478.1 terpene cyclase/mutase family protein [Lactonifactor longoviformis]
MKNRRIKRWTQLLACLLTAVILMTGGAAPVMAQGTHKSYTGEEFLEIMEGIIDWKKSAMGYSKDENLFQTAFAEGAGTTAADWFPVGIGRSGYPDDYSAYLAVLGDQITKKYTKHGTLDRSKATEWHRISLAVLSLGGDPTDIGTDGDGNHVNLIADGSYYRGKTTSLGNQGINGMIWGLIQMDSLRYVIPEDATDTRDGIVKYLLSQQKENGGFSLIPDAVEADVDITGMAVQALAPYYNSEQTYTYTRNVTKEEETRTVRQAVDDSLALLSQEQSDEGDYSSWGSPNSESVSQVIVALCSLGINPAEDERFIKNGNTLVDGLMKYRLEDGGFIHSKEADPNNPTADPTKSNDMASQQALYALTALCRYYGGMRSLYDFRPEQSSEVKSQIAQVQKETAELPVEPGAGDREKIQGIFDKYLQIPPEERCYVYSYHKLADAMEAQGIQNTSESLSAAMNLNTSGSGTVGTLFGEAMEFSVNVPFSSEDAKKVTELPDSITTESYTLVVSLLDKWNKSENKDAYAEEKEILEKKKAEIEAIQEEIDAINQEVIDKLYPVDRISLKEKETVKSIVARCKKLSEYDQKQIQQYEDIQRAETMIRNRTTAVWLGAVLGILAVILIIFVVLHMKKRKRQKLAEKMMPAEDDEEDWED